MKSKLGSCPKCGGNNIIHDLTKKDKRPRCVKCKIVMPIIYEDDPEEDIYSTDVEIKGYGWEPIGVEEQEDRAIENGADEDIFFYVPYEVYLQGAKKIKRYVEKYIA